MINMEMIELILGAFGGGVWLLMSKTPIKSGVKLMATGIFNYKYTVRLRSRYFSRVPYETFEKYMVKFFATLLALFFISLAQMIDVVALSDNLSDEWVWISNAELVSAAGIISLSVVKYSLSYYVNLLLTAVLIGVVGSSGWHRFEKWISGNSLLFDILRQWLIDRGTATDDIKIVYRDAFGNEMPSPSKLEALRKSAGIPLGDDGIAEHGTIPGA